MPKFDENTGFKMPGVGSKEIDSPGSFRDEHHVDKMGYCDNTPDDMLPEGSSPLKARYTSSGYLKDLDVIRVPRASKKECPEGSVKKNGECVPINDGKVKQNKTSTSQLEYKGKKSDLPKVPSRAEVPMLTNKKGSTRTKDTSTRKKTFNDMKAEGYSDAEIEEAKQYRKNNPDEKNIGFTTTTYTVNGKKTDKAGYDAAGPGANRTKS